MMKKLLLLFAGILISIPSFGQFSLRGEVRPRIEFRDGYRRMPLEDEKPAGQVNQRTRLSLDYDTDRVTTMVSFQDVRLWGQDLQRTHNPSFDLHQAWIELAVTDSFFIKAGRQELRYDNQRFFAINNWLPQGQQHDALLMKYLASFGELHLGTAFNQTQDRLFGTHYPINNYKTLNFLWFNTDLSPMVNLSLLGVADGYESDENPERLYVRGTWSTFWTLDFDGFRVRTNPALQYGNTRQGQDIRAWYFMAEVISGFVPDVNTRAGFELYSGNDFEDPGTRYRAFDPLYGAGHANHGYMDYFTNIPAHTGGAGLFNPYIRNRITLTESSSLDADLHLFFLQNNYVHDNETISKYLGTEIDLTLNYRFNEITFVTLGYSVMFGSESMEVIKGGSKDEFAHWGYIMLSFRPVFF